MRKVKCEFWDRELRQRIKGQGLFHQWAAAYEEFSSGPGNYTVGIVELPGGRIVESLPSDIQFLEDTDAKSK